MLKVTSGSKRVFIPTPSREILKSFLIHFCNIDIANWDKQCNWILQVAFWKFSIRFLISQFKFCIFRNFNFLFLIYDFWFLTCEFWILVSEFWCLISDFKYRVNYSLKIRYSIFINRKSELDYFHFVVFWILEFRKQVGRKASWLYTLLFKAYRLLVISNNIYLGNSIEPLGDLLVKPETSYNFRKSFNVEVDRPRTEEGRSSFKHRAAVLEPPSWLHQDLL